MATTDSATQQGTQGQANPEGSNNSGGQPSSEQKYITVDQFNEFEQKILRTLQSNKDRAVKGVAEKVNLLEGSLKEVLQAAKAGNKSIDDLLNEAEVSEEQKFRTMMMEFLQKQNGESQGGSHGSESKQAVDVSKVLKELQLPETDTRVLEFKTKQFASAEQAGIEAALLVKKLSTNQPSDADKPSDIADRASAPANQDALMAEYTDKSKTLYGNALIDLKMQMRKKGLKIS